jgi:predicted metal-binding protein
MSAPTVVTICSTCRPEGVPEEGERTGAVLGRAVVRALAASGPEVHVETRAIACLSACSRACSVAFASPGKFAYVIGNLLPEDAGTVADFAIAHAKSADGVPPWRERPEKVRKNTISRVPPADAEHALVTTIEG